jgi:hypothetical protein
LTPPLSTAILAKGNNSRKPPRNILIKMEEMNQGAAEAMNEETVATEAAATTGAAENVEQPATVEETPAEEASTPDETGAAA